MSVNRVNLGNLPGGKWKRFSDELGYIRPTWISISSYPGRQTHNREKMGRRTLGSVFLLLLRLPWPFLLDSP